MVAIQPGHRLVTTGVHSVVCHPSYLGLLVATPAWGLTSRSVLGVVLTAMIVPVLVARIRSEENLLRQHFGGEYEAYCGRTPSRLIPGVYWERRSSGLAPSLENLSVAALVGVASDLIHIGHSESR